MSSETLEDFIEDYVLLHTVKSPGYKEAPPVLVCMWFSSVKNRRNPRCSSISLCQTDSTVLSSHWLLILNHLWKMSSHDRIYIAAPAVVSLAGCTAMLSITSYKFQLSPSSDKITHAPTCQHSNAHIKEEATMSDNNKIILSLNLISTTSTVDKLHSSVIKADLA